MRNVKILIVSGLLLASAVWAVADQLVVKAQNELPHARPSQTIELSADLLAPLGESDLTRIHVQDAAGQEVLCQAVDTDFDAYRKPDIVIFQADFAPNEEKTFTVSIGDKQVYTKDQFKAHGRFVRERFDDFAWENDRIAHRTYGKALETWEGEPLSSSTIDVWSKRVPQMVIDEWYMTDNYHTDTGQGADFYSAGPTRGCGGNGLWADDRLWLSRNFIDSRVLANGPIRVMFELDYEPFDVNGVSVAETKRITLDAGSNLDRFQSFYHPFTRPSRPVTLTSGIGIKKVSGAQKDMDLKRGWLTVYEKMAKDQGMEGLALVVDPDALEGNAEDKLNNLLLVKAGPENQVTYWAGFFWDKTGHFEDYEAWKKYVDQFAQGLKSPIQVGVTSK